MPAAIAVVVAAYAILPAAPLALGEELERLDVAEQALVLGLAAVGVGLLLSAVQVPIYRILEGYTWPRALRQWAAARHRRQRHELLDRLEDAHGVDYGLLLERLHRYPSSDEQIAPTRLGNAIRALEVFGWDHYRLDSQTLWSELVAVAPEPLQNELDRARAPVDFCVAALALSLLLGVGLGALAVADGTAWIVAALAALVLVPVWYALAVSGTAHWRAAVQALVNVGRLPLAAALGLAVPADPREERAMWQTVTAFVRRDFDPSRAARLAPFRTAIQPPPKIPTELTGGLRILLHGEDDQRSVRLELRAQDERLLARSPPYNSRTEALRDLALLRAGTRDAVLVDTPHEP